MLRLKLRQKPEVSGLPGILYRKAIPDSAQVGLDLFFFFPRTRNAPYNRIKSSSIFSA